MEDVSVRRHTVDEAAQPSLRVSRGKILGGPPSFAILKRDDMDDKPYGCREFGTQDIDGHDIGFGQVIS
jgi:hypothetical protein